MTNPPTADGRTPQLGIIRMALLGGVLLFGAVIWFLHRQPGYVPDGSMEPLRPVVPFIMLAFVAGIIGVRVYLSRVTEPVQLHNFRLIGWAMGEAAALCGGVYYLNTNDPRFFIMGLFVQLASFIVVPLRQP
jgi:hypothetical protein